MPIHLPPIRLESDRVRQGPSQPEQPAKLSRRQFLSRAITAGAALALTPELFAAKRSTDQHAWALFSDVHIAGDRAFRARGVNMTDHFTSACQQLLQQPKRPAGLLIDGDCAYNSGQPADYAQFKALLEPLREDGFPVHLALGNHDERTNFAAVFPEAKDIAQPVPDKRVSLVRTARANWILLDSLERTLATPGLLGTEQLAWVARTLDENPRKPALVLAHHNPGLEGGNMGLKDTLALLEVLRPRKQVKAFIYGHTHAWKVERDASGLHLINLPAVAYVFRESEPSGWVWATLKRNGMRLQLHCIDLAHKLNGQTLDLEWRKDA